MASIPVSSPDEWHAIREQFVGGSEIAALFYQYETCAGDFVQHAYEKPPAGAVGRCLSPYLTGHGLFNVKSGLVMPENLDDKEYVVAGQFLEPAMAEWAKSKWSWPIRKVRRYLSHDRVAGWGASLDYELHAVGLSGVPVQFKNVDRLVFQRAWQIEGDEIIGVPLHVLLQLQHEIAVADADHGWVVACVGGNRLLRGRIERHDPTLQRIESAVVAFWDAVRAETPPLAVADYSAVADAFAYGTKGVSVDLSADDEIADIADEYLAASDVLDKAETRFDHAKARVALKLGEATKATAPGIRISWPVIKREAKLIPARQQDEKTYRGALSLKREEK